VQKFKKNRPSRRHADGIKFTASMTYREKRFPCVSASRRALPRCYSSYTLSTLISNYTSRPNPTKHNGQAQEDLQARQARLFVVVVDCHHPLAHHYYREKHPSHHHTLGTASSGRQQHSYSCCRLNIQRSRLQGPSRRSSARDQLRQHHHCPVQRQDPQSEFEHTVR
jgi:hypothetical protein